MQPGDGISAQAYSDNRNHTHVNLSTCPCESSTYMHSMHVGAERMYTFVYSVPRQSFM